MAMIVGTAFSTYYALPWQEVSVLLEGNSSTQGEKVLELNSVPSHLVLSLLLAEDHKFLLHHGFNFEEARNSLVDWASGKQKLRGASTLSQQTSRILFLSNRKSLIRKTLEYAATVELERRFSKSDILRLYFSYAQWGEDIYGLSEASVRYFGKEPKGLSTVEASILAVMLPNPQRITEQLVSGNISEKLRTKLMQVNTWTEIILLGMEQDSSVGSSKLLAALTGKDFGKLFYDTWLVKQPDLATVSERFELQFNEAINNLRQNNLGRPRGTNIMLSHASEMQKS